jgi:hypothetical protein
MGYKENPSKERSKAKIELIAKKLANIIVCIDIANKKPGLHTSCIR